MCWDRIIEAETPDRKPVKQSEPFTPKDEQRPVVSQPPTPVKHDIPELVETS